MAKRQNPVLGFIQRAKAAVDSTMMNRMPKDFQDMFKKKKPKPKEKT